MVQDVRERRRRSPMCLGAVLALATLTLAVRAPAAQATELVRITTCGQSVSSDAVLAKDLTCPGDGVVVTGDGVTVSLGGHALRSSTGTGRGVAIDAACPSTATVRGPGRVKGFKIGIDTLRCAGLRGSPADPARGGYRRHLIVDGAELLDNTMGIRAASVLTDLTATTIRGTHGIVTSDPFSSGSDSIGDLNVDRSSITSTGTALRGNYFSQVRFSHSTLRGGTVSLQANSGFQMEDSAMKDVRFWCSETGIDVERSLLVDNSMAIGSFCGGRFRANLFRSTQGGTALRPNITGDSRIVIEDNRFSGWDDAILLTPDAFGVEIIGNRFTDNVTGILAPVCRSGCPDLSNSFIRQSVIRDNTLLRNSGDAITLNFGKWTLGGNLMKNNGGLGINASGPLVQVTDEGGNVARGNAEPQCVGVVCLRR